MATVASVLVDHFIRWGIEHVFGIPGKSVVPLVYEMDRRGGRFILAKHEAGAGFAAAGYALMTKRLGVAIGTSGPGGTNMLTAAGQAKAFHLPVLFITGHPSVKETGKSLCQDSTFFGSDLGKMFEPVTLFSAHVSRGDLLRSLLAHAVEKASGGKGPVHLAIPWDVLREAIDPFYLPFPEPVTRLISSDVNEALRLIEQAQRPVLFVGKGVHISEAYEEVRMLSERRRIPVMTTPGGKGTFPTRHPFSLGGFGLGGTESASQYLKSGVDLMIVVGTSLNDMTLAGFSEDMYPEKVLHFDCDPTYIGKSIPVPTHAVLGDAKHNLKQLLASIKEAGSPAEDPVPNEAAAALDIDDVEEIESHMMTAKAAIKTLRRLLPKETVVIGDEGSHSYHAILHFDIEQPGTFHFDDLFGAMGYAIGYAIGAKTAAPERPVVCLTGDGCTFMHGAEFSTAAHHRIPVIFVVLNNGRLDMVDKGMSHNLGKAIGTVFDIPLDVKMFAESMGLPAFCCRTEAEIAEAVDFALHCQGPTVIEIVVDPFEIPPTLSRG